MDLRAKITDAVHDHIATAADQPKTSARRIINAVMGAVKEDHGREKCVRWGLYTGVCDQMHDAHEEAEGVKARLAAVRELHALHEKDRAAIDPWCYECNVTYPCPTLKALDGGK